MNKIVSATHTQTQIIESNAKKYRRKKTTLAFIYIGGYIDICVCSSHFWPSVSFFFLHFISQIRMGGWAWFMCRRVVTNRGRFE